MDEQPTATVKPCPICGREPRTLRTIWGSIYLACQEHVETKACPELDEAIELWNHEQYEAPLPPRHAN